MKQTSMTAAEYKAAVRSTWSEAEFTREVIALARSHGFRVAHFRTVRVQRKSGAVYYETPVQGDGKGFPDLILLRGAQLVVAELKVGRGKPTREQEDWLLAFRGVGAEVHVWTPEKWYRICAILESAP